MATLIEALRALQQETEGVEHLVDMRDAFANRTLPQAVGELNDLLQHSSTTFSSTTCAGLKRGIELAIVETINVMLTRAEELLSECGYTKKLVRPSPSSLPYAPD